MQKNQVTQEGFSTSCPIYKIISEVKPVLTSHSIGLKKILMTGHINLGKITQIAWGCLKPTEKIPSHIHYDMDEFFFFITGTGIMTLDDKEFIVSENVFLSVPARVEHVLFCSDKPLEYFYFGIQVFPNL